MPLATLAEVMQFEKWLDEGFRDAMLRQGVLTADRYFLQFESNTGITERIEIESIPGGVDSGRQCYILPDNTRTVFNTFNGALKITVVTNRQEKQNHTLLLGMVRAALTPISLGLGWQGAPTNPAQVINWRSEALTLTDIYLSGESLHIVDNENNLDKSELQFALLFNVLDTAWPLNI